MVRPSTSSIWEYYDKSLADPSHVSCKKCKSKISRGSSIPAKMTSTNMKNHLKATHKDLFDKMMKTDGENNEKKRKAREEEENAAEGSSTCLRNKKQRAEFLQLSLPESLLKTATWPRDHPQAREAHKRVLLCMITDLRPYSDINKGGLLQLLKFLCPKFEPNSNKFYRDMMQSSYVQCKETIQDMINKADPGIVSLTMDGWSSQHHGYVGVNIHYIDEDWVRRKVNIGCKKFDESHTGQALANFTEELAQEWNVYDKIGVAVTDSAANMVKMFEYLPGWDRADCANHTFQLVINDEILNMASVEGLAAKCRTVCSYANRSVQFSQALIEAQVSEENPNLVGKCLVQDVVTRWNSTYNMMKRFHELKEAVSKVLDMPKWEEKIDIRFYNNEWDLMAKVVSVLRGFMEATEMLSSSQASISQVIPLVTIIAESLKNTNNSSDHGVKTLKSKLKDALAKRFDQKELDNKYAIATLLDPKFKDKLFQSKWAKDEAVKSLINELKEEVQKSLDLGGLLNPISQPLEEPATPEENFTIKGLMRKVLTENQREGVNNPSSLGKEEEVVFNYLAAPVQESGSLEFWKIFEKTAEDPVRKSLAKIAKKYLTPPPTETDVERLFSVAGNILTDERNRLLPENVDKLLFMKENIRNLNFKL